VNESDYKRRLVAEVKALGGHARRVEDRFAVGVLDLILKLPGHDVVMAEGKVIDGFKFAPTARQYEEGEKWIKAGVGAVLIGWQNGVMYLSHWTDKADRRTCKTYANLNCAQALAKFLELPPPAI
jgi:hypothetical protein